MALITFQNCLNLANELYLEDGAKIDLQDYSDQPFSDKKERRGRKKSDKYSQSQINECVHLYNLGYRICVIRDKTGIKNPSDIITRIRQEKIKSDVELTPKRRKRGRG